MNRAPRSWHIGCTLGTVTVLRLLALSSLLVVLGCAQSSAGTRCTTAEQCGVGEVCIDEHCVARPDAGPLDAGRDTGPAIDAPFCPAENRCGADCCEAGEECVDAMCLAECASEIRCGPEYTCCGADQLCIAETCVDPGDACEEIFDCPANQYCETGLGRCLPRVAGRCEYFPPPGEFEPAEEWAWDGSSSATAPASVHVMMTPVVGDLTGDGIPEVVFMTYNSTESYGGAGVLRAVRGDTGEEVLTISDRPLCGNSGIALGDLDGDGTPEIVVAGGPCAGGPLLAFEPDGTLAWASHDEDLSPFNYRLDFGAPTIADLEGDGRAEVIVGATVFESDGTLRFHHAPTGYNCCGDQPRSSVSAAYDVDDDPELEIVGAAGVWNHDGTVVWENRALPEGFVAVADFFADGQPDIVVVHGNAGTGAVSILRGDTGESIWGPISHPGGGRGGPPTVADFDGDGLPEIGVAGAASYSVYDPDGEDDVLWSTTTQDTSSNITGSSVFDFDGDGRAEVVYNDECYMRIYAGPTGEVLREVPQNSHTLIEYPVIVDVDAAGNAEIVFAANNAVNRCGAIAGWDGSFHGIRAFGDGLDNWVGTRTVWNQHAYSITNVREDLAIPRETISNHTRFNNFRQNPQSFDAPDLVALAPEALTADCPTTLTLRVRVENRGAVSVGAGVSVAFYLGGRLVGTARTEGPLLPGMSEVVSLEFEPAEAEVNAELPWRVVADDDGTGVGANNECDETNNEIESSVRCESLG